MSRIRWTFIWNLAFTAAWTSIAAGSDAPKVLLYHSFDQKLETPDAGATTAKVTVGKAVVQSARFAERGKAALFPATGDNDAHVTLELASPMPAKGWTIALWQILEEKDWLTAPDENLLTLLDAERKPVLRLTKSGLVIVPEGGQETLFDCFDALYWVNGCREHLAVTYDAEGSGVAGPSGMLRVYWKGRPYASYAVDLDRSPASMVLGQAQAGFAADELYIIDQALPLRAIWELMRQKPADLPSLESRLAAWVKQEARRPAAARAASWAKLAKKGQLVEAEANPGQAKPATSPADTDKAGRRSGANNNASTASGRACVEPGVKPLVFTYRIAEAGEYTLALRYCLARKMAPLWPQNSKARTPWTENFATVDVRVDGKPIAADGLERLYPTGTYSGHAGDVEMWAWHALAEGRKTSLAAGEHVVSVTFREGLAHPAYDALLISKEAGPRPPHPRWVDLYRIPPAWWVEKRQTAVDGRIRRDRYTVTLRNRCDEPCDYEIVAGPDALKSQTVKAEPGRIELGPLEEKAFTVTFQTAADAAGVSEWANVYLWNEDVACQQEYRLWNMIPPRDFAGKPHPALLPAPDPTMQAALRAWLKTRDEKALTPELRKWLQPRSFRLGGSAGAKRVFSTSLLGERLKALDAWMKMSAREIEQYLPDGPAEHNGYGSGWERVGIDYSGVWHGGPPVKTIAPAGDIDLVTSVTVEGPDRKDKTKTYTKTYVAGRDNDIIGSVRDTRWQSMVGDSIFGSAPYGDGPLGRTGQTGIPLLAEAYYLTGDRAYAQKAFEMLMILARKYTGLTKHFHWQIHREDRDWWGGRVNGRYQSKYGMRHYQSLGTYVLDLLWDALTPHERNLIEHNVQRWGMYEGMCGPLFEVPSYFAAVNREDMPYIELGEVVGDVGPRQELQFFYDLYKRIVLPDGIHQCSIGSYGGVGDYAEFMRKLHDMGVNVTGNPALRNLFTAQPSFIFAGGGVPNIDDGGGVSLNGLGAGFGCARDYEWGRQMFNDRSFEQWPLLIKAAQRVCNGPPEGKAERMNKEYLSDLPVDRLWPNVYIAPIKGMAMLRNRVPKEPVDWVEVIFDYGRYGGRAHGHPAKLATIPSFNGQIVSMEYGYGMHGNPVSPGFHMRSYAHNVVVADGRDQFGSSGAVEVGKLRESGFDKGLQWIDADSRKIYDGIYLRRTLFVAPFGIVDLHLCQSDVEHTYDWLFHSFGVATGEGEYQPVGKLADQGPLAFAQNPRQQAGQGLVKVTWENAPLGKPPSKASTALLHEKAYVRLWALPEGTTTSTLFGIVMVPQVGGEIDYAMLRRKAKATVFAAVEEPWRESTGPKIKAIRSLKPSANGREILPADAVALEVTTVPGERWVFFANYSRGTKTVGRVTTDANLAAWRLEAGDAPVDQRYSRGAAWSAK